MKKMACWMIVPAFLSVCSSPSLNVIENKKESRPGANLLGLNTGKALYASYDYGLTWTPAGGLLPDDTKIEVMEKKGAQLVLATENYGLFIGHPDNPICTTSRSCRTRSLRWKFPAICASPLIGANPGN